MKIYTKGGDKGEASLYNGERRAKDSQIFHALGDVDELNSTIGLAREHLEQFNIKAVRQLKQLEEIQSRLFDVGSNIATPEATSGEKKLQRVKFDPAATQLLETWIDEWSEELPPLTKFILPSGGVASATLHLARTICRRAERSTVSIYTPEQLEDNPAILPYLNRLSDYLFTAARMAALFAGKEEVIYCKARDEAQKS